MKLIYPIILLMLIGCQSAEKNPESLQEYRSRIVERAKNAKPIDSAAAAASIAKFKSSITKEENRKEQDIVSNKVSPLTDYVPDSSLTFDVNETFDYHIKNFESASLPLFYDSDKEPNWRNEEVLKDSLFVVNFIDSHQYDEEAGNRTYGYYKGKKIFQNDSVVGIVYLYGFSIGHSYWLYTYRDRQVVDSLKISEAASDFSQTYGKLDQNLKIWRKTNYFDYDSKNDSLFVRYAEEDSFLVDEGGRINKLK